MYSPSARSILRNHGSRSPDVTSPRNIKPALHGEFYRWASARVDGKIVLDAGSGDGAGTAMLSSQAKRVIGIDLDKGTLGRSSASYPLPNLEFSVMDCHAMSFEPASFDVVVTNALIEYLPDLEAFLAESFRVLRPGGLFLCGTKNLEHSLKTAGGEPLYKNHMQELTAADLRSELGRFYGRVTIFGETMTDRLEKGVLVGRRVCERRPQPTDRRSSRRRRGLRLSGDGRRRPGVGSRLFRMAGVVG